MNIKAAWNDFFFAPASARPLAALRVGIAATLLVQAFLLRGVVLEFFSSTGYVQGALADYLSTPGTPTMALFTDFFAGFGLREEVVIYAVCGLYVLSLLGMVGGLFTRASTIVAWFLHWVLMNTNETTNYGADLFAHVFLFYLMFAPSGDAWSLDRRLGRSSGEPSVAARLSLRIMQLHLCIMYLASGIEKASGEQWWNGQLLWRAFNLPVYRQFDMSFLVGYPMLAQMGGWLTLVLELGYCVFIWPRLTRKLWTVGVTAMHLGIAVFLGLGVFGCMMAVLTPALFGVAASPVWEQARRHLPQARSTKSGTTSSGLPSPV